VTNADKIPFRFYFDFMIVDWQNLPTSVRGALSMFLEELEKDPDDPALLARCEEDGKGRFAHRFYPGYVIYWRVIRETPPKIIELKSCAPIRIEILALISP
jgi:hypothetical protein